MLFFALVAVISAVGSFFAPPLSPIEKTLDIMCVVSILFLVGILLVETR